MNTLFKGFSDYVFILIYLLIGSLVVYWFVINWQLKEALIAVFFFLFLIMYERLIITSKKLSESEGKRKGIYLANKDK